jgi:hypothetical protein
MISINTGATQLDTIHHFTHLIYLTMNHLHNDTERSSVLQPGSIISLLSRNQISPNAEVDPSIPGYAFGATGAVAILSMNEGYRDIAKKAKIAIVSPI